MGKNTPADRAKKWQTRFEKAETDQRALFKRVSKYYDIMYAVQNTDNMAPWRAKIYVPVLASKAWDLVARFSNITPYFKTMIKSEYKINDKGDIELPREVINRQSRIDAKLAYDYDYSQDEPMKLKVSDTLLDATVAGTGFAKASWAFKEQSTYERQYDKDGGVKDMSEEVKKTVKSGCNEFEPVNFFNVFISNNATSYQKSKWVIVRYFKSIDELKENQAYKNVEALLDKPQKGNFDIDNQARNRLVNEQKTELEDETVPTATTFEVYENKPDGMHCGTYGIGKSNNSWVELEEPFKKYWHNYYPVQPFYTRRKSYSPWSTLR